MIQKLKHTLKIIFVSLICHYLDHEGKCLLRIHYIPISLTLNTVIIQESDNFCAQGKFRSLAPYVQTQTTQRFKTYRLQTHGKIFGTFYQILPIFLWKHQMEKCGACLINITNSSLVRVKCVCEDDV